MGFPGGSVVKNLLVNSGDSGLLPGLGRYPGEEMATHSSILAWQIPQTEEAGRLQSMGSHDLETKPPPLPKINIIPLLLLLLLSRFSRVRLYVTS